MESVEGVEDDRAQFAKLIGFSRHRREKLGHRRVSGDDSGRRKRQSAPRAFGTNDHGRGLEFGEDLKGETHRRGGRHGRRDGGRERRVFAIDLEGTSVLWGLRVRITEGARGVNAILLKRNKELFEGDKESQARQRAEGYALYEEKLELTEKRKGNRHVVRPRASITGLPVDVPAHEVVGSVSRRRGLV